MHSKTIHKTHDFQSLAYGEPIDSLTNLKRRKDLEILYP